MGITVDFLVESEKARLQFGDLRAHGIAMRREQRATLGFGRAPGGAQFGVTEHALNRHAGRFQAAEKTDPFEHRTVVRALARRVARGVGNESDALVIADRVRRQTRERGQFAYLHVRFLHRRLKE